MIDGILNINKSAGMTSFNVVAAVRRLCHERHVGHAGTLDPLAEGVLPVCLGRATRIVEYLVDSRKTYQAEVEFGIETDTGDAEGKILRRGEISSLALVSVLHALDVFRGRIQQTPPMYSALKYQGRPLYKFAREGVTIERKSRTVDIYNLELLSWNSPVCTIDITCSHGTYIRSLAEDLGRVLGCGAHLRHLVRLACGPFDISGSTTLSQLEEAVVQNNWVTLLHPVDSVLLHWPAIIANASMAEDIRHGKPVVCTYAATGEGETKELCRAYTLDGYFLGVLRFNSETGEWQPKKIFL
jgi:tRNA pseudouridine55 synthase